MTIFLSWEGKHYSWCTRTDLEHELH